MGEIMKLVASNLDYFYKDGDDIRYIIKDLNVSFESGKIYAIVGESGSGKTTLLSLLGALDRPKKGDITLDGKSIFKDVDFYRSNSVSFVFQNYNLIPYLNAVENIKMALDISKKNLTNDKILENLNRVGIDKSKVKRLVTRLSGGEMQRVAIARAISTDPEIILCDEPTGNLDSVNSEGIVDLFLNLAHDLNKCIIFVTHNKEIARKCDVIYNVDILEKKLVLIENKDL